MSNVTYYRNWDDGLLTDQTSFSSSGSGIVTNPGTYCRLTPSSTGTDVKTWLDFIPSCTDFDTTFTVLFPSGCGTAQQICLMYRTTYKGSANDSYAYVLSITQNSVGFGHGSNSPNANWTSIGSAALNQLANDTWHTVRIVVSGTSHSVYVNNVLIQTWTDSTYTNSGSIGFRLWAASTTSYLGVDSFTIATTIDAMAPMASLASGTYTSAKTVTLSSVNTGNIYYTTDGTTPTTSSSVYTTSLAISTDTVLKAIQAVTGTYISGSVLTDVATYSYAFIGSIPTPIISTNNDGSIILSDSNESVSIYYTLDNSMPTIATAFKYLGAVYSKTTSYTITAVAYLDGAYSDAVAKYIPVRNFAPRFEPLKVQLLQHAIATPTLAASFVGYLPDGPKVVVASGECMPLGPSFGMKVSDGSLLQLLPIKYIGTQYPRGKKVRLTYNISRSGASTTQELDPQKLVQNDVIGTLNISPVVNNDGPLSLRQYLPKYTWDASIPDGQSIVDVTILSQWASKATNQPYRIYGGELTVATPVITPASGVYSSAQTITIDCATASASIYYTLDGSSPTTSSLLYTGPFQLGESAILSVLAVLDGMFNAPIVQRTYSISIPLEPIIFPPSGTYGATITCALSSEISGATIYYTTDGSDPTINSTVYTAPFLVPASATIKAFATKPGHADSSTTNAVYKLLKWLYNGEGGWTQAAAVFIANNGDWERLI